MTATLVPVVLVVVGPGAPLGELIGAIPPDAPYATVVVGNPPAPLPERIVQLEDGQPLREGALLAAPATQGVVFTPDGTIELRPSPSLLDVDGVMVSLAEVHRQRAVAVLLGSPETSLGGARAVHDGGGLVLADEGAIPLGSEAWMAQRIDRRLPAQAIPIAAAAFLTQEPGPEPDAEADGGETVDAILALLNERLGIDFSEYKRNTIVRRICRRMAQHQLVTSGEYLALLGRDEVELATLSKEFLIGVTRFFRDPDFFDALRDRVVGPLIAQSRGQQPIRVWVAGCSTGEEAYTLAMLFRESLEAAGSSVPVKIFATDLDGDAIAVAGQGTYSEAALEALTPERRDRWFVRRGERWQVARPVREMVVFAVHNLTKDPPFYHLDLITCRNLLIYLRPALQRRLFAVFHFALNSDGHLGLGSSESLGEMGSHYQTIDQRLKLFRKKPTRGLPLPLTSTLPGRERLSGVAAKGSGDHEEEAVLSDIVRRFGPAMLVVDERLEVAHAFGDIDRYLRIPSGRASHLVTRMACPELSLALSTGIRRVLASGEAVVYEEVRCERREDSSSVRLVIHPLPRPLASGRAVLVLFQDPLVPRGTDGKVFDPTSLSDQRIRDLESDLERTNLSLQAAIEELETSNEELQATNEEVLAANEELQSSNEELQSVNEELSTVNSAHQAKITDLTEANDDLLNFLSSVSIGTLFLDQRLCIRKFTPLIVQQINLLDKDLGRPLAHLTHSIPDADLVSIASEVLRTLVPHESEVRGHQGRWYLMRVIPYRTEDDVIKGVVMTFIDIDATKRATESLRTLQQVVDQCGTMVMITDREGVIAYVNPAFSAVTGWSAAEAIGRPASLLESGLTDAARIAEMWETLRSGRRWEGRFCNRTRAGAVYWEEAVIVPMADAAGHPTTFLKTSTVVPGPGGR